ncbi:MAG: preprotein translocase subunit SecE [Caldilineaceae bacterium]
MVRYLKDKFAEVAKVTWPTREEGIRLTWVVFVVTIISAIVLFGVDTLFGSIISLIIRSL